MPYIENNLLFDIKYIFLNFAQALFSQDTQFTWNKDALQTKILIVDKNALDIGVAKEKPIIIVDRGDISWANIVRGQVGTNVVKKASDVESIVLNANDVSSYTDLIRGSITYRIISKNGLQAEMIADLLWKNLTAYSTMLLKYHIKSITNMSISGEQIVRAKSDIELVGIQLSLMYTLQAHISQKDRTYNCRVYDINNKQYFESIDFTVMDGGTITFNSGYTFSDSLYIDYVDAITYESVSAAILTPDADNPLVFTLPENAKIAGYYKVSEGIVINDSNLNLDIQV